jgi:hypothetical protein
VCVTKEHIIADKMELVLRMNPFLAYGIGRGYFRAEPKAYGEIMDDYAMKLFPLTFLIFSLIYWYYYVFFLEDAV